MKKFYALMLSSLLLTSCQADEPGDINLDLDEEPQFEIELEENEKTENDDDLESGVEVETEIEDESEDTEDDNSAELKTKAEVETEVETKTEVKAETTVREFNMTAQNWSFSPSTITVNEGDTVVIHITSEGNHGFKLSAFGINETMSSGETTTIKFVADQKGTFTFTCSVPCGSGHMDMTGTLIVS